MSSTEIVSTIDKLHSAHFISCVLKYTGKCFKRQVTQSTNNLHENAEITFFNRNSLTVTIYENALERALQITYSVLFHKVFKVLLFFIIILGRLKGIDFGKQVDENKTKHSNQRYNTTFIAKCHYTDCTRNFFVVPSTLITHSLQS